MNKKYKTQTIQLADILEKETYQFILKSLKHEDEQNTSDLIDLVLSAHLSSAFNMIKMLSQDNEPIKNKVDEFIKDMVGDLERIKLYPEKGFQIPQDIPSDVWEAYKELVRMGYTKHLIRE